MSQGQSKQDKMNQNNTNEGYDKKLKHWSFLKAIIKPEVSGVASYITGLLFAKHYLLCIIIIVFMDIPILQIVLSFVVCLGLGVISILSRPFKKVSKNVMIITVDIVAVLTLIMFLLVFFFDSRTFGLSISEQNKYYYIGNTILALILSSIVICGTTALFDSVKAVYEYYQKYKKDKQKKKGAKGEEEEGVGKSRAKSLRRGVSNRKYLQKRRKEKFFKKKGEKKETSESMFKLKDLSGMDIPENLNSDSIIMEDIDQGKPCPF